MYISTEGSIIGKKAQSDISEPSGILFYGDPDGEWQPLISTVIEKRPHAVVILGDCGLEEPLKYDPGVNV